MGNKTKLILGFIVFILVLYTILIFDIGRKKPAEDITNNSNNGTSSISIDGVYRNLIKINNPKSFDIISSPVTVTGSARGNWFFEASFPIQVFNYEDEQIGGGIATAKGDWMTTDFVPFEGIINFSATTTISNQIVSNQIGDDSLSSGYIRFMKDNPSGLPEFDDHFDIPVYFVSEANSI